MACSSDILRGGVRRTASSLPAARMLVSCLPFSTLMSRSLPRRGNDLDINVLKGKQLTNIRAAGKDEAVRLTPPRKMSLEQAIAYIEDDELVEVTPKSIRLRKRFLNPEDRKRARKQAAAAAE